MSPKENNETRLQMKRVLQNNRSIVDTYLRMEYNICLEKLVVVDNEQERGKAQFIKKLLSLME